MHCSIRLPLPPPPGTPSHRRLEFGTTLHSGEKAGRHAGEYVAFAAVAVSDTAAALNGMLQKPGWKKLTQPNRVILWFGIFCSCRACPHKCLRFCLQFPLLKLSAPLSLILQPVPLELWHRCLHLPTH
jgi:hypothetical protein